MIQNAIIRRKRRTRAGMVGTKETPRLSVFRSNAKVYAQLIDDVAHKTLIGISETKDMTKGTKTEKAKALGLSLAILAQKMGVKKAIFDKGPYRYHGRIKALAEGAREGGLVF